MSGKIIPEERTQSDFERSILLQLKMKLEKEGLYHVPVEDVFKPGFHKGPFLEEFQKATSLKEARKVMSKYIVFEMTDEKWQRIWRPFFNRVMYQTTPNVDAVIDRCEFPYTFDCPQCGQDKLIPIRFGKGELSFLCESCHIDFRNFSFSFKEERIRSINRGYSKLRIMWRRGLIPLPERYT